MPDTNDIVDVIFKKEGADIVAIFPSLPGTCRFDVTCYAHVGQHGSADIGYVRGLRPASPTDYADLKQELEAAPYNYRLRVVRRITQKHAIARAKETGQT